MNKPARREITDDTMCDVPGCDRQAKWLEAVVNGCTLSQPDKDGDRQELSSGVYAACDAHAGYFMSEISEYTTDCPNCGCDIPVN